MDEFYHHGILGQKWGVRRFQKKDGTLTSAGKKRYGEGVVKPTGAINDGVREKTAMERLIATKRGINPNLGMKRLPGTVSVQGIRGENKYMPAGTIIDGVRNKTAIEKQFEREHGINPNLELNGLKLPGSVSQKASKNHSDMTDEQLRKKIERMKLEKQYRDLETDDISSGKRYAESILKDIGKQTLTKVGAYVLTGALLYGAKAVVSGRFDFEEFGNAVFNGGPKKK